MSIPRRLVVLFFDFATLFGCLFWLGDPLSAAQNTDLLIQPTLRKTAPGFALEDAVGRTIRLSDYKGKVVLLDFWATWCHGCKTEIPWYVEFDLKYRSRGLAVIGVSMDDGGMKVVRPFLAPHGMRYPVVMGSDGLAKQYDLGAMPLTLLIDRESRIALSHSGVVDKDDFEGHIQELLR